MNALEHRCHRSGKTGFRVLPKLVGLAVMVAFFTAGAFCRADDRGVRVVPIDKKIGGYSYNDLAGLWWNWALEQPAATSPLLDVDGSFCSVGQHGKVWFLAGNFGGETVRSCTIPAKKALFFPIVNDVYWAPDDGDTVEEIRAGANADINVPLIISCTIDGKPVPDLFAYRAQSPAGGFPLAIPAGSLMTDFGVPPGLRFPAVADGYWIGLKPLSWSRTN